MAKLNHISLFYIFPEVNYREAPVEIYRRHFVFNYDRLNVYLILVVSEPEVVKFSYIPLVPSNTLLPSVIYIYIGVACCYIFSKSIEQSQAR